MDSGIYFIGCSSFVKIGVAWSVRQRFTQLQVANPLPIVPLGFIAEPDSGVALITERRIHERFIDIRHRGEWFRRTADLEAFIVDVATTWPKAEGHRRRKRP